MIGRPPRSTLFPTTTLSRSTGRPSVQKGNHAAVAIDPNPLASLDPPGAQSRTDDRRQAVLARDDRRVAHDAADVDRKSTRLNSSHANISYAVFCLKKKKKTC